MKTYELFSIPDARYDTRPREMHHRRVEADRVEVSGSAYIFYRSHMIYEVVPFYAIRGTGALLCREKVEPVKCPTCGQKATESV